MILSSIKCVSPNCNWVIVYCTLSTPEISAQLGPLPISTTCAGALWDSGKMSKQRTLLNVFKPSSSSSSQGNDSEGTTAASEGTSGGPSSESRKRKQAPVPDGGDTQIKKSVTSATGKSFRRVAERIFLAGRNSYERESGDEVQNLRACERDKHFY